MSKGPCATAQRVLEANSAHQCSRRRLGTLYVEERWNSDHFVHASDSAPCQISSAARLPLQFQPVSGPIAEFECSVLSGVFQVFSAPTLDYSEERPSLA